MNIVIVMMILGTVCGRGRSEVGGDGGCIGDGGRWSLCNNGYTQSR